ncbi:hypothetical protein [Terrabacter terrigena]|uniref:Glycosyltransferase RgtA/B/C/D-like domain-containing protein n=1 Tax=Terrabacter terrigena TaxID=574718 RepID=A0ABW3MYN2_9MICO
MPAVIAVAFLVTQGVAQAVTPFIRQDDWTFLLPDDQPNVAPPRYYNISEGRWLNTGWWWLVGQHGTPTTAALTYAAGYAVLVAGMWRVLHRSGVRPGPVVDALLGLALYASCVWVQLLYWPGALTPSVLVGAAAMWLLPRAAASRPRMALWLLLSGVAAVLSYPPIGVVLLVFAVVFLRDSPWRRVLGVTAGWVGSFAAGVAVAYTLNWIFNQHFGIEMASWRNANPLTSLDALRVNAGRWFESVGGLWAAQWWVALVGLVAAVLGWRETPVRARLQRLLVAFVVASGLDAAQTLVTGTVTEARGQLWTWLVAVLPVAFLLLHRRQAKDRGVRAQVAERVPALLLAVLAVAGVLSWRADIGAHQATRVQYDAIAEEATAPERGQAATRVVVYQDPAVRNTRDGRLMASTMFMAVRQETGGVQPRWCRGDECTVLARQAADHPVVRIDSPAGLSHVIGIVVPAPPGWV